ncbi:hypothetical protein [Nocardia sp. GTS18]|uniref:hypothetical protein n=1 Tax=Nocardia sp. GTS18 TaxID=1778064 RepID=UPI0015EEFCDB|nr:hypothetical protein [Nocardia sp. GTS18]
MIDEDEACRFCGRFVLEVEGWAEVIQPYHQIRASWDANTNFFWGSFHLGCIRNFPERAMFRREAATWISTVEDLVQIRGSDGVLREVPRRGLGYTDLLAQLPSGVIYENPRFNEWAYVEESGPLHFIDMNRAQALGRSERVRGSDGGRSVLLSGDPQVDVSNWDLPELLDFLDVRDLYQDMLDTLEPRYHYLDSGRNRFGLVLDYSLSCIQPYPPDLAHFFGEYLAGYVPKRLEDA